MKKHRVDLDSLPNLPRSTAALFSCKAGESSYETVLLGNVAYRAGGAKLQYDAKTGRVSGNNNAEQYLRRDYRRGWTL